MTDHTQDGLLPFSFTCDELGVELVCWFEHDPAERGARSRFGEQLEPDYPATWTLHHVYVPGSALDLAPVLRDSLLEEIEAWVADQADDEWRESRDEWEISRYVDSRED